MRTFLTHHLIEFGVTPRQIVEQLSKEEDPQVSRALLLSLGIWPKRLSADDQRRALVSARMSFMGAPSAAEHSAAEWLLRRLNDNDWLAENRRKLSASGFVTGRDWYVNKLGMTMALIDSKKSKEFKWQIAVSTTEIPRRLFQDFRNANKDFQTESFVSPFGTEITPFVFSSSVGAPRDLSDDAPQTNINWFEAAAFCRWLSEQEGVGESQMCYPPLVRFKPVQQGFMQGGSFEFEFSSKGSPKGSTLKKSKTVTMNSNDHVVVSLPAGFVTRSGYRLPTVGEWKYVVALSPAYSSRREELIPHYAWYRDNSRGRLQPVTSSMPNSSGVYDLLGNAAEWCSDSAEADDNPYRIRYGSKRIVIGGSVLSSLAALGAQQPTLASTRSQIGFRVVRTVVSKE